VFQKGFQNQEVIAVAAPKFIPTNISARKPVKIINIISAHSGGTDLNF
jgi:hypothetical protein